LRLTEEEETKRSIDRIWATFCANETTNPLTVVEQITFIIFAKLLDDNQISREQNANLLKVPLKDPIFKKSDCLIDEEYNVKGPDSAYSRYMSDAQFEIHHPKVLAVAVAEIAELNAEIAKGLKELQSA